MRGCRTSTRMKKIGAFGLTEPLGGSDVAGGTRTTARRDGDSWILNGAKRWIGNATFSDWVVIYARDVDDNKVKGFLVDTSLPGYSATKIENKISLRTVQNADITLDQRGGARLLQARAREQLPRRQQSPEGHPPGVAWQAVGQQLAAFDVARSYAVERKQFGRPLASFQLVQNQLVQHPGQRRQFHGHDGAARPSSKMRVRPRMSSRPWPRPSPPNGCGTAWQSGGTSWAATGSSPTTAWPRSSPTPRPSTPMRAQHEINTLVTGRAVTGISAIV